MSQYYLDIETTGLNPEKDKIISIQLQAISRSTGESSGELIILKEWESSEKEIIKKFISISQVLDEYPFAFIPIGNNLNFEHNFFKKRAEINNLPQIDILNHPFIDLRSICVIMNNGEFKDSGLDKMTGKASNGKNIPVWYQNKEYDQIIQYIENETEEFIRFLSWLYRTMPEVHDAFKSEMLDKDKR